MPNIIQKANNQRKVNLSRLKRGMTRSCFLIPQSPSFLFFRLNDSTSNHWTSEHLIGCGPGHVVHCLAKIESLTPLTFCSCLSCCRHEWQLAALLICCQNSRCQKNCCTNCHCMNRRCRSCRLKTCLKRSTSRDWRGWCSLALNSCSKGWYFRGYRCRK